MPFFYYNTDHLYLALLAGPNLYVSAGTAGVHRSLADHGGGHPAKSCDRAHHPGIGDSPLQ
jgi:hypothetical protein